MSDEIQFLRHWCEKVQAYKDSLGIPSNKIDDSQTDNEIRFTGIMAEYAVCKKLNVPFNTEIHPDGDHGIDQQVAGKSFDVKFTSNREGDLIFNSMKNFRADIAILCTRGYDEFQIAILGVISRDKFCRKSQTKDFGHGQRVFVPQSELYPFVAFLTWVDNNGRPSATLIEPKIEKRPFWSQGPRRRAGQNRELGYQPSKEKGGALVQIPRKQNIST